MASFMTKWSGLFRRVANARLRRRELSRLSCANDETSTRLALAIDSVIRRSLKEDEQQWINAIEHCRHELANSSEEVSFIDYGAGEPDDHLDNQAMQKGRQIRLSLAHLCHHTSQGYPWAHLFFQIVRQIKPQRCLELGTCLGFSAAYQTAALELNQTGKLVTLEGADPLAQIARRNFDCMGLRRVEVRVGRFTDILGGVLSELGPFGFVYIDGHHDGDATLKYFEQIIPSLADDAIVVFDDILWYDGMKNAWSQIKAHERVRVSIDLGAMGIVVVSPTARERANYNFLLH